MQTFPRKFAQTIINTITRTSIIFMDMNHHGVIYMYFCTINTSHYDIVSISAWWEHLHLGRSLVGYFEHTLIVMGFVHILLSWHIDFMCSLYSWCSSRRNGASVLVERLIIWYIHCWCQTDGKDTQTDRQTAGTVSDLYAVSMTRVPLLVHN